MRIHQYALIFVCLFILCVTLIDVRIGKTDVALAEKEELTNQLKEALNDATLYLAGRDGGNYVEADRNETVDKFFLSLYSNMGIMMDEEERTQLELYFPVLVITDIDGFYLYYYQGYVDADGSVVYERMWSEKQPYSFEDENFVYSFQLDDGLSIYDKNKIIDGEVSVFELDYHDLTSDLTYETLSKIASCQFLFDEESYHETKKQTIIDCVERKMSYYISKHNIVASQKGVSYHFEMPNYEKNKEWASYIEDINLIIVFQGYSYGYDIYAYNNILSNAANIIKKEYYLVEEKGWYKRYHLPTCNRITGSVDKDKYYDEEECIQQGAYACEHCIINGATVPDISKQ